MKLYFIRHGESIDNREFIVAGQFDSPLSPHGEEQAHKRGKESASLLKGIPIVSSSLSRARKTAEIISEYTDINRKDITVTDLCMERSLGKWDNTDKAVYLTLLELYPEDIEPDFEPAEALKQRAADFIAFLRTLGEEEVVVVSHNGFGKMLFAYAENPDDVSGWYERFHFNNCEMVELEIS